VAFKGYVEVAKLLLEAGADPNADQGGGTTPLMLASLFGRASIVRLLQERGANATARNRWGISAAWLSRVFRLLFRIRHPLGLWLIGPF
jgi:ankyrin repeat protein